MKSLLKMNLPPKALVIMIIAILPNFILILVKELVKIPNFLYRPLLIVVTTIMIIGLIGMTYVTIDTIKKQGAKTLQQKSPMITRLVIASIFLVVYFDAIDSFLNIQIPIAMYISLLIVTIIIQIIGFFFTVKEMKNVESKG